MQPQIHIATTALLALSALPAAASQQAIDLQAIEVIATGAENVSAAVYLGSDDALLELEPRSILGERALARSRAGNGGMKTYSGRIAGEPGSRVAASIRDGRLRALVWRSGGEQPWWIAPANELDPTMPGELYSAMYSTDLPDGALELNCGVLSDGSDGPRSDRDAGGSVGTTSIYEAEVLGEADYEFVQFAGSKQAAEDLMEETFFFNSAIYEFTFGIRFLVFDLIAYDDPNDPYTTSGQAGSMLSEFQSEMAGRYQPDEWDLAQLFTGRPSGFGGYAYCSKFCRNTQFSRSVSFISFTAALASRVGISAHEFGHNLGSGHCNQSGGNCGSIIDPTGCGIMNSGIGGTLGIRFGNQSITNISTYPYLYDCVDPSSISGLPPTLTSLTPLTVEALLNGNGIQTVDLTGTELDSVHQVQVGSKVLTLFDIRVVDNQTVYIEPPIPTALGPVTVSAANATGWSNSISYTYVATNPPRMNFPLLATFPFGISTDFGGNAGVAYQVIISDQNTTTSIGGFDVLSSPIHTETSALDAAGLGSVYYAPPTSNTTYWMQFLTRAADGSFFADDVIEVFYQ